MRRFETFGENIYNTFFNSDEGFDKLKEEKPFYQAVLIVIFISILDPLVKLNPVEHSSLVLFGFSLLSTAIGGIISWLFFGFFVEIMASIFGKSGNIRTFLILSAFALLPWIFLAPIELLKNNPSIVTGFFGILFGLIVWLRTVMLFLRAIAKTYETTVRKTLYFVLIPFIGSIIYFHWFIGFFTTLGKILF
ncbi:MAG: YIP1 family protein [Candidatus Gastranaerophilales bacterium]|nr:YIP1 family protein [Candidatus Gastranaerophilales bacterium]